MEFNFNFGPGGFVNPQEIRMQQLQQIKQGIDEKRCVYCQKAYLVNDQIAICSISKECVNNMNGQECKDWNPIDVII